MKPLFFVLAFLGLNAFASADDVRNFRIENAQFSQDHLPGASSGLMTLNYTAKKVTMTVYRNRPCPIGQACIAVMPGPAVIELPITSIKYDDCGIANVTAQEDYRMVDGALSQIQLQDISKMTCMTFAPVIPKATYTTQFFSRLDGKEVTSISKMELAPIQKMHATTSFPFAEGTLIKGFPSLEIATAGSLTITEDSVVLHIVKGLNCEPTAPCPAYMPSDINVTLPIQSRTKSFCGDKIVAALDLRPADGALTTVEVTDYRKATCEIALKHLIHAEYTREEPRINGPFEAKAVFFFDVK